MRLSALVLAFVLMCLAPAPAFAADDKPGREPERISRASDLEPGHGAVIVSVRSELFLLAELDLFFVREGGDIASEADVIRFSRAQSALSLGNSTTKHKPRAYQVPAGRYRLAGHGVKCPKVPDPQERCLADVSFLGIGETVSFPSRGYGEDAPAFEVRAGALTVAGDFALRALNTIEWSEIPQDRLAREARRFSRLPRAPAPEVSEDFRLKYPLRPRSQGDDSGRRY